MANNFPESSQKVSLAEEIRNSERMYVDGAIAAFRIRIREEYRRMRAYAIEAGQTTMVLDVHVVCGFDPANRYVHVQSRPNFMPPIGETKAKLQ